MKAGRPTKYDPKYCQQLIDHMNGGLSFEAFGGKVDVTEKTLYNWRRKHRAFLRSYKKGLLKSLLHWEEMGHDMVLAGQGNATTWIFNMKNRFRKQGWSDMRVIDKTIRRPKPLLNDLHNNNSSKEAGQTN